MSKLDYIIFRVYLFDTAKPNKNYQIERYLKALQDIKM